MNRVFIVTLRLFSVWHSFFNYSTKTIMRMITKLTPVFMAAVMLFLSACSPKIAFNTSTVVPTAEGSVKVKKDKNGNYVIDTEIVNLAPPDKLPNPQQLYVVWADTPEGTKNLGQIKTSKTLFGKALKAGLAAITTTKPSRVYVTAEQTATAEYPGNYVVLTTDNF